MDDLSDDELRAIRAKVLASGDQVTAASFSPEMVPKLVALGEAVTDILRSLPREEVYGLVSGIVVQCIVRHDRERRGDG